MKLSPYNRASFEELEKANRVINQFVISCSHSMRGPLKSIKGLVSLLHKSKEIPEMNTFQFLDLIEDSAYKMENMLDELEQILENTKRKVIIEPIDWNELLLSVLARFGKEINNKKIKIEMKINHPVNFSSDRMRLYLILSHVVENAIQFQCTSKAERFIHISVQTNQIDGIIRIADNGIGIHPEVQEKIFELFCRATPDTKGAGVGLYVVREAIEKMGGSISVESSLGKGSAFILTVPNLFSVKKK